MHINTPRVAVNIAKSQGISDNTLMGVVLPDDVTLFFTEYLARLQKLLPHGLAGCYLYGSAALGAYDPVRSDLDFLVVLTSSLGEITLPMLDRFHADLCREFPLARKLEGHFVPLDDIPYRAFSRQYPSVADGAYQGLQGVMTLYWYQLHTCGVRITGPAPEALFPSVPWELVQQEMERNINGYWYRRALQPEQTLLGDGAVDFAVLTLCRILYTLEHQQIISKADAGQWVQQILPASWHPLIQEAVRIRTGDAGPSLYTSCQQRAEEVRQFILAIREQCNRQYFAR